MYTELRCAAIALTVLACLATTGRLPAEERDSDVRRHALKLNEVTGMDPIRGEVKALLADKAGAKKFVAEAARMAKEKPQPFNYNASLILATVASKLKDYEAAETFYRLHMEQAKHLLSVKGLTTAYGGLIEIYYANKKYAEAEKLCKEALELKSDAAGDDDRSLDRFKSAVMEEMILSIARQGDTDRAIDLIDRILKNSPNSWLALDLKASVFRIAEKNAEAAKVYEEALERLTKDKALKKEARDILADDIRYKLSGLYVDLDQVDKAAEQLKALLARDPDSPTYNNDLGYIWADHDMNLEESEKLVRKAMDLDRQQRRKTNPKPKPDDDKDSAAYLDSLGWVKYKQKKYQEAKKYLQQAVAQEDGNHIEILDHLGDVQLALGDKAAAVATWKKAADATGDTKREHKRKTEVLKKIKANE
jgi:tetratricopeptide (TPR) repeat protein